MNDKDVPTEGGEKKTMKTQTTTPPTEGWHQRLVLALTRLKYVRFGEPYWTTRYRWLYLPWQWAYKKSAHGGWFYLTLRTPIEMIVGVENLARWQNKRAVRRRQNEKLTDSRRE